ncbi:MAG: homocysteine S-methyltransferase family protein, partial [Candidatus Aminicenantes bacterium]|nr:homocysteine S-methyltransferase family protein [Candidatus Aminicenantes bacterium]
GNRPVFIAGSIGPVGKLIYPLGDLTFTELYHSFAQQAKTLEKGGADLLLIETQIDILEAKTAYLAARENTSLPIAVSMTFPLEDGTTVTGTTPEISAVTFSSTGLDIFGLNCGRGPEEFPAWIETIRSHWDKPLIVYANAGIPEKISGQLHFPLGPEEYAQFAEQFYRSGANIIGGCCGTTPEHIKRIASSLKGKKPVIQPQKNKYFFVSSRNSILSIGSEFPFRVIGENINPFGRKKLKQELDEKKFDQVRKFARMQEDAEADGLDVNLGRPGETQPDFYAEAVNEIQNISRLPLFFDNSNPHSLEEALRIYGGKAIINSVNGKEDSSSVLLPLAAKYGAAVILLAMDETGIPETVQAKVRIIEALIKKSILAGIPENDLIIDPIILTIATSGKAAFETMQAIKKVHEMGYPSILGLSNLSFGLPQRQILNAAFLPMAAAHGLDSAIMNPLDPNLMAAAKASDAITGRDTAMRAFISKYREKTDIQYEEPLKKASSLREELYQAILSGEKEAAGRLALKQYEKEKNALQILEEIMVPAIKKAGDFYEEKKYFLPQLIMAAEAMEKASAALEPYMEKSIQTRSKKKIVIATVYGDLHDIGKNIIVLILRNHGYNVIDLGKNIKDEEIIEAALREKADIIGLSALMTTTMEEMRSV